MAKRCLICKKVIEKDRDVCDECIQEQINIHRKEKEEN